MLFAAVFCCMLATSSKIRPVEESARQKTILLVEDEVLLRLDIADFLQDEGYRVLSAASAGEAVSVLSSGEAIDAVVTDVQMPGSMNGLDLARWTREYLPDIAVLIMSGCLPLNPQMVPDAMLISKPFGYREIARRLSALIGRRAPSLQVVQAANDSSAIRA
jgi:DNA-binding response OmpR family regulator